MSPQDSEPTVLRWPSAGICGRSGAVRGRRVRKDRQEPMPRGGTNSVIPSGLINEYHHAA